MEKVADRLEQPWWRNAAVYQVYLRSYKDSDGDGNGDLNGLRMELRHIAELGCDALWLNPIYLSPQRDHGYDIADYRSIDPMYGTLDDFDCLVAEAHELGLRVIMDVVPNHCSDQHPWFQQALASNDGGPERSRFIIERGEGQTGAQVPNGWQSVFGGSAWRPIRSDSTPTYWYLHTFDAAQPDFNWRNPEVREEFESILTWWFDRGVDGFRIDVAHGLVKAHPLPRASSMRTEQLLAEDQGLWNQPEVHDIYRQWRRIACDYPEEKYLVGEVWVADPKQFSRYVADDELHQAFAFDLLVQPWIAHRLKAAIDKAIAQNSRANGPAWTLNNHDVHRAVTRYGQEQYDQAPQPDDMLASARHTGPVDVVLGTRRARAAFALLAALPGTLYLYQGEELGLSEHLDLAPEQRQDPIWIRSKGEQLGRDGCRIPLPWSPHTPTLGFSDCPNAAAWLPQPENYGQLTRDAQQTEPDSMLTLYKRLLCLRKELSDSVSYVEWIDTDDPQLLAFDNGAFICLTNTSDDDLTVPVDMIDRVLISTQEADDRTIPANSTLWVLRRSPRKTGTAPVSTMSCTVA